jgi:hypothetical protein
MTSSDAAALAIIVGPRIGRLATSGKNAGATSSEQIGDQRERVEEPSLVGMVLDADQVEAATLGSYDLVDYGGVGDGHGRDRDSKPGLAGHKRHSDWEVACRIGHHPRRNAMTEGFS